MPEQNQSHLQRSVYLRQTETAILRILSAILCQHYGKSKLITIFICNRLQMILPIAFLHLFLASSLFSLIIICSFRYKIHSFNFCFIYPAKLVPALSDCLVLINAYNLFRSRIHINHRCCFLCLHDFYIIILLFTILKACIDSIKSVRHCHLL